MAKWKSRCFTAALIGAVAGLPAAHMASAQDKKPNIVMLMTDDTRVFQEEESSATLVVPRTIWFQIFNIPTIPCHC